MEFRKKIDISKSELSIDHRTNIVSFGSCFAENIGKSLSENKFRINFNPFGILYNPASISQAITLLLEERTFAEDDIFEYNDLYHTFFHHSLFSNTDKDLFLKDINEKRICASNDLKQADILMITFGTSYVFRHIETGQIVANCHKLPSSVFEHFRLKVDDIVHVWKKLIMQLRKTNPALKILFTVSPIRHWKDGAHNNQLSKAVLLLAIEELMNEFTDVFYFPSYEIVMDELRDYRFYAEDMLHPGDLAVRYIWEAFSETFFDKTTVDILSQWQGIVKAINHRPFNQHTEVHKQFLRQTLLKVNELQNKYPFFECEKERLLLRNRLSEFK